MQKILTQIEKNMMWWLLGVSIAGILFSRFAGGIAFSAFICLLAAFVMIYPSLLPLDFSQLKDIGKNYKIIILSVFINFVVSPLLAYLFAGLFLGDQPALKFGLILLSILPGGGMATSWALKTKAHMGVMIELVIVNLLVAAVVAPFVISYLLNNAENQIVIEEPLGQCAVETITAGAADCFFGGADGVTAWQIALPIVMIIIIPLLLAYFTRAIITKKRGQAYLQAQRNFFKNISNIGMLAVVFLLMSLRANAVVFDNWLLVLKAIIPLFLYYLSMLMIAYWSFDRFAVGEVGRAFSWGVYLRYITLALGLATSLIFQNDSLSLMVIIIMLSYFIQIPLSFVLAKKMNKIKN
jgi:ACR3 family arsenite efflux pump ArsB